MSLNLSLNEHIFVGVCILDMDRRGEEHIYSCAAISPSTSSEDGVISTSLQRKPGRKTDREREECGQRREWTDGEILQLIRLWKENDVLYNTNHPFYYVQTERKMAMESMSTELGINGKDVNDKMHSLRTYFCSQRQRTESAEGRTELPRWKFYDDMSFLYESVTNRAAKSCSNNRSRTRKRQLTKHDEPATFVNVPRPLNNGIYHTQTSRAYLHEQMLDHEEHSDKSNSMTDLHRYRNLPDHEETPARTTPASTSVNKNRDGSRHFSSADELFGHMVTTSLTQIEEGQEKERLKLDIQTMIYNTRFKKK